MTYGMKLIDHTEQVASIELAGALLRAWARGDRPTFQAELDRSSHTPVEHHDSGEAERLQMLSAIAARLKDCEDPFSLAADDAGIGVCARLLTHLARPAKVKRPGRSAWFVFQSANLSETPDYGGAGMRTWAGASAREAGSTSPIRHN